MGPGELPDIGSLTSCRALVAPVGLLRTLAGTGLRRPMPVLAAWDGAKDLVAASAIVPIPLLGLIHPLAFPPPSSPLHPPPIPTRKAALLSSGDAYHQVLTVHVLLEWRPCAD